MFVSTNITINVKVQTMSLCMSIYSLHFKVSRPLKKREILQENFMNFNKIQKFGVRRCLQYREGDRSAIRGSTNAALVHLLLTKL